jgi:hypothetical protein
MPSSDATPCGFDLSGAFGKKRQVTEQRDLSHSGAPCLPQTCHRAGQAGRGGLGGYSDCSVHVLIQVVGTDQW